MVDSLAGYLEECNCKDIYTARAVRTPDYIFAVCGLTPVIICIRLEVEINDV